MSRPSHLTAREEEEVISVRECEALDRSLMLIAVHLPQGVQLPQTDGAISNSHQNGLLAGVQADALNGGCCLSKHLHELQLAI